MLKKNSFGLKMEYNTILSIITLRKWMNSKAILLYFFNLSVGEER